MYCACVCVCMYVYVCVCVCVCVPLADNQALVGREGGIAVLVRLLQDGSDVEVLSEAADALGWCVLGHGK